MNALLKQLDDEPNLIGVRRWIDRKIAREVTRRQEFLDWLDETKRAEFINGDVVVHSPERLGHGKPIKYLSRLLDAFVEKRGLGWVDTNKLIHLPRNDYIPDLCYWPEEVAETFDDDTTLFPAPALAVEVLSPSAAQNDRGVKFDDYAANGVSEYWIVDPAARAIEQYARVDDELGGHFVLNAKLAGEDELASIVLPGLRFAVWAIFDAEANARAVAAMKN